MEYFEPKSIGDALSLLSKHGAEAKVIAGGTDVMVDIKFKEEPGCLVNIKKIPSLAGTLGPHAIPHDPAVLVLVEAVVEEVLLEAPRL